MPEPEPAKRFSSSHPLLEDLARLEKIKNNMHIQIQIVLHGRRIRDDVEFVLPGGASVDDVLQEALIALLRTDPAKVQRSWEALSVEIARNKAKDALSKATSGRRTRAATPGDPDDVTVVSLDDRPDVADTDPAHDPDEAFDLTQRQMVILRLARETLSERERLIFHTGYYATMTNKELGERLGITGQAVGLQFRRILRDLYAVALRDPLFPPLTDSDGRELT